ncbi:MAG: hypothetical protein Q7W02_15725 [Candidatus Rokubacteria bacterium]|nr:hypothetical protein [Candidatus Rokubacteria bacterium]
MATSEEKFGQAARCYLGYGLVYWLGGAYLATHGIGAGRGLGWLAVGAVFVVRRGLSRHHGGDGRHAGARRLEPPHRGAMIVARP